MRLLVTGGNGFIGKRLKTIYPQAIFPTLDIGNPQEVADVLNTERPDIVINAAGKTGRPNVDWCETHKEETLHSNVTGPLVLMEACQERNIYMVHMSSGCIFEGDNNGKGFSELDEPNFFGSFYSRTKAWSDMILADFPVLLLRIRMPFDGSTDERNLIMKLKKYQKVLDQQNSITYMPDFFTAMKILIERKKTGVYHIINPGVISPAQIMHMYKEEVDPSHTFETIGLDQLGTVVKTGRSNCVLNGSKLEKEGIAMRPVEEAVTDAMKALKNS